MKLHLLKRSKGLKDKKRRLGRGNATGSGNYSGKGLKGQKARSGFSMKAFFEGGQTSIIQRLPKAKGFTRYFKLVKEVAVINLSRLEQDERITDDMEITKAVLKDLGYIKHADEIVKILGDGNYSKHIKFIDIDRFSKSAQEKIANPGKADAVKKSTKIVKVDKKAPKVKAVKAPKAEKVAKVAAPKVEKVSTAPKDKAPKVAKAPKAEKVAAPKKITKKEAK